MAQKKRPRKRRKQSSAKTIYKRARKYASSKADIQSTLISTALGVGGAVAAGMLANRVPIADPRLKAAVPLAAGVLLTTTKLGSNKNFQAAAAGMMIMGGLSLLKQFQPNLVTLAGEEETLYLPDYAAGQEDYYDQDIGAPAEIGAPEEFGLGGESIQDKWAIPTEN